MNLNRKRKVRSDKEHYWRKKAKFLESILDSMHDLVLVKREKSHLVWANKPFQDFYGMSNRDLKNLIDSPINEPDYTIQYIKDDEWVWKNKSLLKIDCEPVTKFDGETRKFETFKTPVFDKKGEIKFTVGVSRDITEEVSRNENLEHTAKMASLGEMASNIAHEINNPLAIIQANVDLILRKLNSGEFGKENVIEKLSKITVSTDRIVKIVQNLKVLSRERQIEAPIKIDAYKVLEQTLEFCQERIKNSKLAIHMDKIDKEQFILSHPVMISQILLNLINNAYDALETSQVPNPGIFFSLERFGDFVHFRVWDNGPGVPSEISNRIMQPFFTTKDVGKGTGLGLSVSLGIAKRLDGNLKLDRSHPSKSCFLLSIPIAPIGSKSPQ